MTRKSASGSSSCANTATLFTHSPSELVWIDRRTLAARAQCVKRDRCFEPIFPMFALPLRRSGVMSNPSPGPAMFALHAYEKSLV
jgi:hypothetical protein